MKLHYRDTEKTQLREWSSTSAKGSGLLTLMVGRRRVGKTALLSHTFSGSPTPSVYFFISRKQEALLCQEFTAQVKASLNIPIYGNPTKLREIIEILLQYSCTTPITLIIDEFQDLQRVKQWFFL